MSGSLKVFPVYWSKQHGAYITMIFCWCIAVLLSHCLDMRQFIILPWMLAGLNAGELLMETFKRKSPLPASKKFWFRVYFFFTLICSVVILFTFPRSVFIFSVLFAGGLLIFLLSLRRLHKSAGVEWLTFSLFSLAALLAWLPSGSAELVVLLKLWLWMSIYFGTSVFNVKVRLDKMTILPGMIYVISGVVIIVFIAGLNALSISLSGILILKSLQVIFWKDWYVSLKIQQIGLLESGWHLVFAVVLFLFFR